MSYTIQVSLSDLSPVFCIPVELRIVLGFFPAIYNNNNIYINLNEQKFVLLYLSSQLDQHFT